MNSENPPWLQMWGQRAERDGAKGRSGVWSKAALGGRREVTGVVKKEMARGRGQDRVGHEASRTGGGGLVWGEGRGNEPGAGRRGAGARLGQEAARVTGQVGTAVGREGSDGLGGASAEALSRKSRGAVQTLAPETCRSQSGPPWPAAHARG